jgi:hypothetical protein
MANPKKSNQKRDDPSLEKRFEEAARLAETAVSVAAATRAFKILSREKGKKK